MTQTIADFVTINGLGMTACKVDRNPAIDGQEWGKGASHYRCTIFRNDDKRSRMVVYFSMGSAHTGAPKADDVLDCLASDASCTALPEIAGGFEEGFREFASDMGYDLDSHSARKTYRAILRQTKRLKAFLGEASFDALVYDTERA